MASVAQSHESKTRPMARVIIASSAGTAFEWYDFFIFGSWVCNDILGNSVEPGLELDFSCDRRTTAVVVYYRIHFLHSCYRHDHDDIIF